MLFVDLRRREQKDGIRGIDVEHDGLDPRQPRPARAQWTGAEITSSRRLAVGGRWRERAAEVPRSRRLRFTGTIDEPDAILRMNLGESAIAVAIADVTVLP